MAALDGITILDLTRLLPGAVATMILRSEGAEVIKIEEPGRGDYARSMEPLLDGTGAVFRYTNPGKKSITLDLKSPAGQRTLRTLLSRADILVEGFRPGVMERLGFGYGDLAPAFPELIYASLTGFPRDSPQALEAGHDLNYMAAAGLLGWPPAVPAALMADICGGSMQLVRGILCAIIERYRTGLGSRVDVAMSTGVWPLAAAPAAFVAAGAPNPLSGGLPCYGLYETSDAEWLAVAALEPRFWGEFCSAAENPEWIPRQFDSGFTPLLAAAIRLRTAAEWERRCQGRDCCVNRVRRTPVFQPSSDPIPELGQDNDSVAGAGASA